MYLYNFFSPTLTRMRLRKQKVVIWSQQDPQYNNNVPIYIKYLWKQKHWWCYGSSNKDYDIQTKPKSKSLIWKL